MNVLASDLDGTLVDTREATVWAYRQAGAEMPQWAWGRPWSDWLDDPEIARRKHDFYDEGLRRYARPLAALSIALEMSRAGWHLVLITGASLMSWNAVRSWLPRMHAFHDYHVGQSLSQRVALLERMAATHLVDASVGVYLDDTKDNIEAVNRAMLKLQRGFQTCHVS